MKKNTLQIFIGEKRILLTKFPQILPQNVSKEILKQCPQHTQTLNINNLSRNQHFDIKTVLVKRESLRYEYEG